MSLGTPSAPHLKLNQPSSVSYLSTHPSSQVWRIWQNEQSHFFSSQWVRGNIQAKGVMKMLEQNRRIWISAQEMVYITHSFFQGLWWRFPYSPTDVHLSQPVDSSTSISELVDKVLTEVGRPESRASKTIFPGAGTSIQMTLTLDRPLSAFHDVGIHFSWWSTSSTDTDYIKLDGFLSPSFPFLILSFSRARHPSSFFPYCLHLPHGGLHIWSIRENSSAVDVQATNILLVSTICSFSTGTVGPPKRFQ